MKSAIRSMKNQIKKYDEGEILVRELTSNEQTPPSIPLLIQLSIMLRDGYQFQSIVEMLFKRLSHYDYIRHVEKALICIEYLIKNAGSRFVRYCQTHKGSISQLTCYRYTKVMNGAPVDYGDKIRKRAQHISDLLFPDSEPIEHSNKRETSEISEESEVSSESGSETSECDNRAQRQRKTSIKAPETQQQQSLDDKETVKTTKSLSFESFIDSVQPAVPEVEYTNDDFLGLLNEDCSKPVHGEGTGCDTWWGDFVDEEKKGVNTCVNVDGITKNEDKKDARDADSWVSCMAGMDNVLEHVKVRHPEKRNRNGMSIAQMGITF